MMSLQSVTLLLIPFLAVFAGKPKPPRMQVQLYAERILTSGLPTIAQAYLVLPNGDRAVGQCLTMSAAAPCIVEAFAPEHRVSQPCINPEHSFTASCITEERYYADRKGNDVTLFAANGHVTFHIIGSWTSFELGTLTQYVR